MVNAELHESRRFQTHRVETDLRKEDVTWSVLHGGGWSKTQRITRWRVDPSSITIIALCHIPLTAKVVFVRIIRLLYCTVSLFVIFVLNIA